MTNEIERLIVTALLLALVVVIVAMSAGLSPVARWMPLVVALPTLGLLCLEVVADAARAGGMSRVAVVNTRGLSRIVEGAGRGRTGSSDDGRWRDERQALIWLALAIAAVLTLGMLAGLPLYLLLYLRLRARQRWTVALGLAGGLLLVMYAGLDRLLRIPLY
jgi:uncharacterized membrane protein YoaK (UPF0700 family)